MNSAEGAPFTRREGDREPLRIGYLINQYPKPSHTFIRTEMRELERDGHQVARLALRGWKDQPQGAMDAEEQASTDYLLKAGLPGLGAAALHQLVRSPLSFARAVALAIELSRDGQAGLLKHVIYLLEACWLVRWAKRREIMHLHAHFGTNTAAVATIANELSGLSYSFTVHGPEEFDAPRQLKLREKAATATFVVAITSFCRSQLFRWVDPQHWSKIKIVRCTPDPAFLADEPTAAPSRKHLVCVGRLCEQKGQLLLIEALRSLKQQSISLTLAGDGEMCPEVEQAIRDAGLEGDVSITGWVDSDRVKQEILAADALVLPSFAEGLPVVIMEAMALGRPVISTMIAGIPELVRNGVDGLLVPAGDSRALAEVIAHFFAMSEEQRQQLASSGRERVRALHEPAHEAGYLADLIRSQGTASRT